MSGRPSKRGKTNARGQAPRTTQELREAMTERVTLRGCRHCKVLTGDPTWQECGVYPGCSVEYVPAEALEERERALDAAYLALGKLAVGKFDGKPVANLDEILAFLSPSEKEGQDG